MSIARLDLDAELRCRNHYQLAHAHDQWFTLGFGVRSELDDTALSDRDRPPARQASCIQAPTSAGCAASASRTTWFHRFSAQRLDTDPNAQLGRGGRSPAAPSAPQALGTDAGSRRTPTCALKARSVRRGGCVPFRRPRKSPSPPSIPPRRHRLRGASPRSHRALAPLTSRAPSAQHAGERMAR